MINRFRDRIRYAHLKDVRNRNEWAEVGHGDVDWNGLLPVVASLQLPWWITEMDTTNRKAEESMAMSYAFLKDKLPTA
jgi:sugar phosphate isomerase/epimerase